MKNNQKVKNTLKIKTEPSFRFPWIILLILLITFLAYYPVLQNKFTNWDDPTYITDNTLITRINLTAIKTFFSEIYFSNYHPLTLLSYMLDHALGGMDPLIYHLTNLLIHILNTFLVYLFIKKIHPDKAVPLITSVLFGVHPLHVESVAWLSERKDVLFCFFYLVSLLSYLYYIQKKEYKYLLICFVCFIFSCLSKSMAVSLPLVLILIDFYYNRLKFSTKIVLEKLLFFSCSIVFGIINIYAQKHGDALHNTEIYPFFERIFFAIYSLNLYLFKHIIPFHLAAFYPYPATDWMLFVFYPVLLLLVLIAMVLARRYYRNKSKDIFFGFAFFVLTISLVLQLLPAGDAVMADRYTYLPSVGLFFAMACIISTYLFSQKKLIKIPCTILLFIYIIYLSYICFERCKIWKDGVVLWSDQILKFPKLPLGYNNRGYAYNRLGKHDIAIKDFNKAIELKPDYSIALCNLGDSYYNLNQNDLAIDQFSKALKYNPDFSLAFYNRGNAFGKKGDFESAINDFNKAIQFKEGYGDAFNKRGMAQAMLKKYDLAYMDFNKAISINPGSGETYFNIGITKINEGKKEEACPYITKAVFLGFESAREAMKAVCK